jgi:hypothetical protein
LEKGEDKMSKKRDFAALLCHYMDWKGFTPDRLSRRSDVPKATIVNWRKGIVSRPRDWQPVAKIAETLELNRDEADEFLEVAGHPTVCMLLQMDLIEEDRKQLSYWDTEPPPQPPPPLPPLRRIGWIAVSIVGLIVLLVIGWPVIPWPSLRVPIWQEDFDPIEKSWDQFSARWQDTEGPGAVLVENGPDSYFGKVESEVITVDVDTYPILRIVVSKVDLRASYSVQLLGKGPTHAEKIVLNWIEYPEEHTINIANEMGWQGSHSFTINIWISGEGKSATFDLISIEAN